MDQKIRIDIRIIKFQDYIRRKPKSPFGYYGLGIQYMLSNEHNLADKMFTQSLKIQPSYMPAKLGKLECYLVQSRFTAAARYYQKNKDTFTAKKIYINGINRISSSLYISRDFFVSLRKFRSLFVFNERIGILQRMYNNSIENPVVNILLAMNHINEQSVDDRSLMLYNLCANMIGIIDKLRWELVEIISKKQPLILQDEAIAGLFQSIPENAYKTDYLNFLLSTFIKQQNKEKVLKTFSQLLEDNVVPDNKTCWKFIDFCNNNSIYNSTVASLCKKLIEDGWVNNSLASSAFMLKDKGVVGSNNKMFKTLELYGYAKK